MTRITLVALDNLWFLTGLYGYFAPEALHDVNPGLKMMGAFNIHSIHNAGLTFIANRGAKHGGCCGVPCPLVLIAFILAWRVQAQIN
jgi:hypothetical protein